MALDHTAASPAMVRHLRQSHPFGRDDKAGGAASEVGPSPSDLETAYVLASQYGFDRLRQAAGQLAGLLVLSASHVRAITPEHAILTAARTAYGEAVESLRGISVPEEERCRHSHVLLALELIGVALLRCQRDIAAYALGGKDITDALRPLREGYAHLQWAAAQVPGLELIRFSQACCASHPAVSGRNLIH